MSPKTLVLFKIKIELNFKVIILTYHLTTVTQLLRGKY